MEQPEAPLIHGQYLQAGTEGSLPDLANNFVCQLLFLSSRTFWQTSFEQQS